MKWAAGAAVATALVAMPAVGQARMRYTGTTPASVSAGSPARPVAAVNHTARHSTKLVSHKKHKLSSKHATAKKLHSNSRHKLKHHKLSTKSHKAS
jgi:hypothetical protein